jgi:glutathione S-transferase
LQKKVPHSVGAAFDLIEHGFLKGRWVMDDAYTIADPYLFTLAQWIEADGVDPKRIPRVLDHRRRMLERPAVKQAIAQELA